MARSRCGPERGPVVPSYEVDQRTPPEQEPDDFQVTALRDQIQYRALVPGDVDVDVVTYQEQWLHDVPVVPRGGPLQCGSVHGPRAFASAPLCRSCPFAAVGQRTELEGPPRRVHVGVAFDKEPRDEPVAMTGGRLQRIP